MMKDMFEMLFGKGSPFKKGAPVVNMFFMASPSKPRTYDKKPKKNDNESTLKKILRSSKNIEAGQSPVSHAGGG